MYYRILCALLLVLTLSACAKNVTFFPHHAQTRAEGITRVYVDAHGSIYPRSHLNPVTSDLPSGSLYRYMSRGQANECAIAPAGSQAGRLCATQGDLELWRDVQATIWSETADEVLAQSGAAERDVDLVVLVHGFNNDYGEANSAFLLAQDALRTHANTGRPIHFVEVYWDGFQGVQNRAWSYAQGSGPLVGFQMRQLLNGISEGLQQRADNATTVRILTHSSGAFVLGATFGNPAAALPELRDPDSEGYYLFAQHASLDYTQYRVPQFRDLRIAMLAAATPSLTFDPMGDEAAGFLSEGAHVMLAVNPNDATLDKYGLGANFFWSGATNLGIEAEFYCEDLRGDPLLAGRDVSFVGYDFDRTGTPLEAEYLREHAFTKYIEQANLHTSFFADFMAMERVDRSSQVADLCEGFTPEG
ncbi:hypothetical protein [Aurantiacibacter sp. D1-12]|uniref:hypothetical protein n=1 Tax=Aurantiacibacter sp. D1-12 TaxID=2993658 RepID=UPI00237CA019|nr:hypothetical protein [Aurantiacibacter sp. D1-12]MDE1467389.1 hypothetical protein [Aurantiacibacter sp. D1-12]